MFKDTSDPNYIKLFVSIIKPDGDKSNLTFGLYRRGRESNEILYDNYVSYEKQSEREKEENTKKMLKRIEKNDFYNLE
jgi:hypothetical protein